MLARPYRSHKIPACDFCRRRKSRCDRIRLDAPCSLCRTLREECVTTAKRSGALVHLTDPSARAQPEGASEEHVQDAQLGIDGVGRASSSPSSIPTRPASLSGHIISPALARDAQLLEQFISPRDNIAVSHVHPNPYSVYSDDPRNPVVYMKVPRQRSTVTSGNGTTGFKQCEVIEKILEPLGPALIELYFNVVHPPFPILDESGVMKAYQQSALPHALVCEIYSTSLVFWMLSDKITATGRAPPDVRYIWNLTVKAMHDDFLTPSFSTVLACILDLLGRPITSITYNAVNVGSAVALAQSLGLNRDPTNWNLSPRQKHLRIRTWWGLLIHDHWASLCHGTPGHIHRDRWDVALPDLITIVDCGGSGPVSDISLKGAQTFIALCKLTKILGDILISVYSLKDEPLEHSRETLRYLESCVDDLQNSLPAWLDPDNDRFERHQPGALNLRLSFLAVKMCICRIELQATRMSHHEEALHYQSQCIRAGRSLIEFVTSLSVDETRAFWLPYTAYHFASAVTLMMRCALEAQDDTVAANCVSSCESLIDFLQRMRTEANWDLADICLGQCKTTVKKMSEGGYLEFRRRNQEASISHQEQAQVEVQFFNQGKMKENAENVADAGVSETGPTSMADESMAQDTFLVDWQEQAPENLYFPELWQVSYSDGFQHWL